VIKNTKETIYLPSMVFLTKAEIDQIKHLEPRLLGHSLLSQSNQKDKADQEKINIINEIPQNIKERLAVYGSQLPTDKVPLTMSIGEFFYNIYVSHSVKPEAPLAAKKYEKKVQEYAELLDNEEFDIPEDMKAVLLDVLNNNDKWTQTRFGVMVETVPPKYITITSKGVLGFNQILVETEEALGAI